MQRLVVVTTSYPRFHGDAEGHFVGTEVRRLVAAGANVTVLAPGSRRASLWGERIISLAGDSAFGFPGALQRLRANPRNLLPATRFVCSAMRWLGAAPHFDAVVAHFLLPCGFPIATRGLRPRDVDIDIVVHGSDARLFAQAPWGHSFLGRELSRAGARLRFVSTELRELVLSRLTPKHRAELALRSRVEPAAIDVEGVPTRLTARRSLALDESGKWAVIVARLVPGKRVDVALEACRRIPGLQSIVIGDGPELITLKARFPTATFVGHVRRPLALAYISAADVLVSASLREGAPTVVREARALGTPVVCLAAGDLEQWAALDPGLNVVRA